MTPVAKNRHDFSIWYRKLGGLDGGHLAARTKCKINKESVHRVAGGMGMEIIAKMRPSFSH